MILTHHEWHELISYQALDLDEENQVDCGTLDPSKPQSCKPRGILDPQPNNLTNVFVEERYNQGVYLIDKFDLNTFKKLSSI